MFCRLFEHGEYGQILVLLHADDRDRPCLETMFQPPNLGVCAVRRFYRDTEKGDAAAQKDFDGLQSLEDVLERHGKEIANGFILSEGMEEEDEAEDG